MGLLIALKTIKQQELSSSRSLEANREMTKPFSINPKLSDWVPSPQQIKTIEEARRLLDLVHEEDGDAINRLRVNTLNVYSRLHPEVTDPKTLIDYAFEFLAKQVDDRRRC